LQQSGGNSLSRSEYFPIHGSSNGGNLSPPSFQSSVNGQWSDETPLIGHENSAQETTDSLALSSEDTGDGGLSFSPLSSNFASVQPLPAFPTLADFAHQGEAVFPAEKFQTLITMYRAHSQHIMDLVSVNQPCFVFDKKNKTDLDQFQDFCNVILVLRLKLLNIQLC
jgi:hypothetical protein